MGCVTAYGYRVGPSVEASGYAAGERVVASGYRYGSPVRAFGYAVCPLPSEAFLKVTPQVMWLTESNGYSGIFEVESNTNWIVK